MIKDLISPLITQLIQGDEEVLPLPPPPDLPPQGTITFQTPTKSQTTISQPFVYSGTDFTGFKARINGGTEYEEFSPVDLTGLTHSTAYQIEVVAYNAIGLGTWASTYVTTDTPPPPDPTPPNGTVTVTAADPAEISVDVTFTYAEGSQGTDYLNFEYQLDSGSWISARATPGTFTISGLVADTAYVVKVRATNADGPGIASAGFSFVTDAEAPPPTTRWQYTMDGVDDRFVIPAGIIDRLFDGIYIFEWEVVSMASSTQRAIINQSLDGTSANTDLYIGRTSGNSTWDLIIFGTNLTNRTFINGIQMGAGIWQFEVSMITRDTIMRKDGIIGGQAIRTFTNSVTKGTQAVLGARQSAVTPAYDRHLNACIRNFKIWKNGTLVYSNDLKDKDATTQVAIVGANAELQNQNSANWAEVPL